MSKRTTDHPSLKLFIEKCVLEAMRRKPRYARHRGTSGVGRFARDMQAIATDARSVACDLLGRDRYDNELHALFFDKHGRSPQPRSRVRTAVKHLIEQGDLREVSSYGRRASLYDLTARYEAQRAANLRERQSNLVEKHGGIDGLRTKLRIALADISKHVHDSNQMEDLDSILRHLRATRRIEFTGDEDDDE